MHALQPEKLSAEELRALSPRTFDLTNIFEDREAFLPPRGCFFVIRDPAADDFAACAGFRQIDPQTCEIAHFVVAYDYRGRGLGSRLMKSLLAEARQNGYTRVVSHIEPWCPEWRAFYAAHGFVFTDEAETHRLTGSAAVELSLV